MTRRVQLNLQATRDTLRDFQLRTVDHVIARMFHPDPEQRSMRFLVADEVGLGKTYVAKGIIAETVTRLQDQVDRIDVVYVCSNAQIARQNMERINPLPTRMDLADRLTLLPSVAHNLSANRVNMISLTPGTSLNVGGGGGAYRERVVLYWMLRKAWGAAPLRRRGSIELLRVGKGAQAFRDSLGKSAPRLDRVATATFTSTLAEAPGIREDFDRLSHAARLGRDRATAVQRWEMNNLVGRLRTILARSSIATLEPDLVILDEFQRFAGLLEGEDDAAVLARNLFKWPGVRVLLLSATPYRMFTVRGDSEDDGDHFGDFMRTVRFLMDDPVRSDTLAGDLTHYRRALASHAALEELESVQARITAQLRTVMVRTERLAVSADSQEDVVHPDLVPTARDVRAYLGVERVARELGASGTVDYWKSAPYLLSFLEGYQIRRKLDADFTNHEGLLAEALRNSSSALNHLEVSRYRPLDAGHPKMRSLISDLDEAKAFDLIWIPPSLPTTRLSGSYAHARESGFTKRLVFSAWQAAPRAVASVLSYEAERRANADRFEDYWKRKSRNPLAFRGRDGKPADMAKFGLLMPIPALARLGDPRRFARSTSVNLPVDPDALLEHVRVSLRRRLAAPLRQAPSGGKQNQDWYWLAQVFLDDERDWICGTSAFVTDGESEELHEETDDSDTRDWLEQHAELARSASTDPGEGMHEAGRPPEDLVDVLAFLAVAGPANAAYRALDNVMPRARGKADQGLRERLLRDQAVSMSRALRAMFQQPEVESIVRAAAESDLDYWRAVLRHSLEGGLPSVLEEDLHVLAEGSGLTRRSWSDVAREMALPKERAKEKSYDLAKEFSKQAGLMTSDIRVTTMRPHGTRVPRRDSKLRHHFAVRFGAKAGNEQSEKRADNAREAFNGPFWPFVLVSTSVGQEGLDFQPYSHAVVHWNLPHNPIDLEQREGRVNRYKGHAVRKNVAQALGDDPAVLESGDPWQALFRVASENARRQGHDDLVPYWIYPGGPAAIERHVPLLALSRDVQQYDDLKRTLGLYRLSFGQPRQQDLIELLKSAYSPEELVELVARLRINLSPD